MKHITRDDAANATSTNVYHNRSFWFYFYINCRAHKETLHVIKNEKNCAGSSSDLLLNLFFNKLFSIHGANILSNGGLYCKQYYC